MILGLLSLGAPAFDSLEISQSTLLSPGSLRSTNCRLGTDFTTGEFLQILVFFALLPLKLVLTYSSLVFSVKTYGLHSLQLITLSHWALRALSTGSTLFLDESQRLWSSLSRLASTLYGASVTVVFSAQQVKHHLLLLLRSSGLLGINSLSLIELLLIQTSSETKTPTWSHGFVISTHPISRLSLQLLRSMSLSLFAPSPPLLFFLVLFP